ncbi:pilus assembly protein [Blautia sp.]|uniref:TadE-like protein n=1 Tax=Blautia glucerasea TaxID=536633 RepID=A0A6N2T1W4_9FIRM
MKIKKASFTIEAACVMSLVLFAVTGLLCLCFFVHNRSWLTAAACEAALTGSMEGNREDGEPVLAAENRSRELGSSGFFCMENLRQQIRAGKKVTVAYMADARTGIGGTWKMQVQESSKIIDPAAWVWKIKAAEDALAEMGES